MNYSEVISQHLNTSVNGFQLNGDFWRGGKKGKLWAIGGKIVTQKDCDWYVSCGDWTGEIEQKTYKSWENTDKEIPTRKITQLNKMVQLSQAKIAQEKLKQQEKISLEASSYFNNLSFSGSHGYLDLKKVQNFGAKSDGDKLIIPVMDENKKIWSYQKIYKKDDGYEKRFLPGGRISDLFFPIGDVFNSNFIYAVEGYATGCSIFMATDTPVLVCFNSGNIKKAIKLIREKNPGCEIVICADDDSKKEGPSRAGEKSGIECSEIFHKVSYILPIWPKETKGTDFNDLHVEFGLSEVKSQLMNVKKSENDLIDFLGYTDDEQYYCYFLNETDSLKQLTPNEHTKSNLFSMADQDYWSKRFDCKGEKESINFDILIQRMFKQQKLIGRFNNRKIRGYGVHRDNGAIAANFGEKVFYKGSLMSISEVKQITNFYYKAATNINIDLSSQLSDDEGQLIIDTLSKMRFSHPRDWVYVAGWLYIAQVFSALDWRPHIWINGEKGLGKTTILKMAKNLIPFSENFKDATAAGIVQNIGQNAMATIYDEAEIVKGKENQMMDVINLARRCSSSESGAHVRGSSSGKAVVTDINSIFMFGSILTGVKEAADASRIMDVELKRSTPQSTQEKEFVMRNIDIISEWGNKLFSRAFMNFDILYKNIGIIKNYLAKEIQDSRQIDQIAPFLAGFRALTSKSIVSVEWIEKTLKMVDLKTSSYFQDNEISEPEHCMNSLMGCIVNRNDGKTIHMLLEENTPNKTELKWNNLEGYGIKVEENILYIHHKNNELLNLMKNSTQFHELKLLKEHPSFISTKQKWINGSNFKCYAFDWRIFQQ